MHTIDINPNSNIHSISGSINIEQSFPHIQNLLIINEKVQFHDNEQCSKENNKNNKKGKAVNKWQNKWEMEKIFQISLLEDLKRLNTIFFRAIG